MKELTDKHAKFVHSSYLVKYIYLFCNSWAFVLLEENVTLLLDCTQLN